MICISIGDSSQIPEAIRLRPAMLEFRLDLIGEEPQRLFSMIPEHSRVIATCRPGELHDEQRKDILKASVNLGASFVDLEIESSTDYYREMAGYAVEHGCQVIVSYHNPELTPGRDQLAVILGKAYEMGAAVAKIATEVRSREDIRHLLSLYDLPGRKVVIGMGAGGRITRVAAPFFGAEFTFASLDSGSETASGQLTISQFNEIYHIIGPL